VEQARKVKHVRRIYYGWFIVAMAMLIYICVTGFTFGAFGVFVIPVSKELAMSRADINTALILKNLGNAVWAPIVGQLLDRLRARPIMIVCSILFAASFIVLSVSHSLWLSAFAMAVGIPIAYLGAGSLSNTLLIARWFKAQRGRAMMIAGIGTSLGTMIAAPATGFLVEGYGWRNALIVIGVAVGLILLLIALIVREQPGPHDVELPDRPAASLPTAPSAEPEGSPIAIGALLRTPHFWTMCLATSTSFASSQAVIVSFVPMGREAGLTMLQATSLVSVLGGTAIAGGLLVSIIADKVNRVLLLSGLFAVEAMVNGALTFDRSYPTFIACAATLGIASGTVVATFYALLADRFGTASFGTVRGTAFMLNGLLGMVSVRFAGEIYDRTGGYTAMFATFVCTCLMASLLMFSSRFISDGVAANPQASPADPR
jgi:predicted MFS family arabinose efflux permease